MDPGLRWRLLQLADSGFPTGGFAHSGGLEAAMHFGQLDTSSDLERYVEGFLWNVGNASLPFVGAAHDDPDQVWPLDGQIDALLTSHVANRASRTQGRAFVATSARVFDEPRLLTLAERARERGVSAHLAPLFGGTLALLGLDRRETLALHLYLALRSAASAAVRLGVVGPHEAQRLQARQAPLLDTILGRCGALRPDQAATTAPVIDVVGITHDRLYARLFQS